jgi:hypothetical protein
MTKFKIALIAPLTLLALALPSTPASAITPTQNWNRTASVWAHYPSWVKTFGSCVVHHESWNAGLWKALNRSSGASGAFQYMDSTWRVHAKRAGVGTQYSKAMYAPPSVQAAVFAYNVYVKHAQRAWVGTHCGYGT